MSHRFITQKLFTDLSAEMHFQDNFRREMPTINESYLRGIFVLGRVEDRWEIRGKIFFNIEDQDSAKIYIKLSNNSKPFLNKKPPELKYILIEINFENGLPLMEYKAIDEMIYNEVQNWKK